MRLERLFKTYLIFFMCLAFVSSIAAGWMFNNISKAKHSFDLVSQFQIKVNQISSITTDYLLFQEPHAINQWRILYAALDPLITSLNTGTGCLTCLDEIKNTHAAIKAAFDQLTSTRSTPEYKADLAAQLFLHIHELQYSARSLGHAFSSTIKNTGILIAGMVSAIAVLFLGFIISSFLFMRTRILQPLAEQRRAVLDSFQGAYAYDHHPRHDDELGDLSNAFRAIIDEKNRAEKLAKLTDRLKNKNAELEQVIYAASHDLRSPLVNIDGYGQELEEAFALLLQKLGGMPDSQVILDQIAELIDEDIPEAIRFIRASATKMDTLLLGLLKLSRLGRAAIKTTDVEMNQLMDNIATSLDFQIKEAAIQLNIGHLPPCLGDATQVEQVFTNILDNAIKYLDPVRPGVIQVTGSREDRYSTYCVKDNGIGISERNQTKVFEIFQRINPGGKNGEGLGLAIVERIVNRLDGKVWVETNTGHGSCFCVKLPAHN